MSEVTWDETGKRTFETGVDHGVLYIPDALGKYSSGVAWNGLTTVTEAPSGAESSKQYADNIVYLNLVSAEEFGATIEAFTYPDEFGPFNGEAQPHAGVYVGQQARKAFGLSYRTRYGNDLEGTDYGYKLHLVYGAQAAPSEKAYTTINDSPEAMTLSWELTTTPVAVPGINPSTNKPFRPTAIMTIDSTKVSADSLEALEKLLYGTASTDASLPLPGEVLALFSGDVVEVATVAPSYDETTDMVTIPAVTGVVYSVDGVEVVAGPFGPIAEDVLVTAKAGPGYTLSAGSDDDWVINFV